MTLDYWQALSAARFCRAGQLATANTCFRLHRAADKILRERENWKNSRVEIAAVG